MSNELPPIIDIKTIQALRPSPGDVIFVQVPKDLSNEIFRAVRTRIAALFPNNSVVLTRMDLKFQIIAAKYNPEISES